MRILLCIRKWDTALRPTERHARPADIMDPPTRRCAGAGAPPWQKHDVALETETTWMARQACWQYGSANTQVRGCRCTTIAETRCNIECQVNYVQNKQELSMVSRWGAAAPVQVQQASGGLYLLLVFFFIIHICIFTYIYIYIYVCIYIYSYILFI